ncbi:hypothetical protein ACFV2H_36815 [Streptomyces sp. NPDC059629]|uniref:hypothetical protein n=1 Tax=Streptomyces sp. NPDC059629 TaxID=3346889 RepID=UPI003678633F
MAREGSWQLWSRANPRSVGEYQLLGRLGTGGMGRAALFDGGASQIVTRGQVLRTGKGRSFTVSAWVSLSGRPAFFRRRPGRR